MPYIDRNSIDAARNVAETFLKDKQVRTIMLSFLYDSIKYANSLSPDNWNLNLDKKRKFIRLNVGHEFCVEIFKDKVSILCLKKSLERQIEGKSIDVTFKGYDKKQKILSNTLTNLPDCLAKVSDSVACYIEHDKIIDCIDLFKKPNMDFIEYSILNTRQLPSMRNAHSIGFIEYLKECDFSSEDIPLSECRLKSILDKQRDEAIKSDFDSLKKKANISSKTATETKVVSTQYVRNQYVVEYAKRVANGICQDCLKPAPFKSKSDGEPFLETHHIIPLSEGGEDTIENTIALCPNCHRKRHYG